MVMFTTSTLNHIATVSVCSMALNKEQPIHNFTGERKILTFLNTPTIKHVFFILRKYKKKPFFCGHNILTEAVVIQLLVMRESQTDELCGDDCTRSPF